MKRKTLHITYSTILLIFGLLTFLLGLAVAGVEPSSPAGGAGMENLGFVIEVLGSGIGVAGIGGLLWATVFEENEELPGYAGLNKAGLAWLAIPLFLVGPFWLLLAWALWYVPALRAKQKAL